MVKEISKQISDWDHVIIDITGGRKIMTGAALLSLCFLNQKRPNNNFELAYYWLKHFTNEYLNKGLHELGFDSFESVFTPMNRLNNILKEIG